MIKKCLKKGKTFEWPVSPYSFSPIDCSVMKTVWQTQNLILIFNHKYLDNQTGVRLVKVMGFLTDLKVFNYHCSMSWIKDFFKGSKTKIPDPFNIHHHPHHLPTLNFITTIKMEIMGSWFSEQDASASRYALEFIPPRRPTRKRDAKTQIICVISTSSGFIKSYVRILEPLSNHPYQGKRNQTPASFV